MIQLIVYSTATGRVRRVVDAGLATAPNALQLIGSAGAGTGESVLVYNKQGNGADTIAAWQAAVNAHTGLSPDTTQTDWCVAVNAQNAIVAWAIGDPACGDTLAGLPAIFAPWGADSRWTYNGSVFTAPVTVPAVKQ